MGVIEDGSISGVLDCSSEVFAIHYPGYPSSNERAIQTLGGMQQILKVRADKSKKLELYFRPEDPYSHPVLGELQPCTKFLLKISKRTVKNKRNDVEHDSSQHVSTDSLHINEDVLCSQSTETTKNIFQPNCDDVLASKAKPQIKNGAQEQLSADIVARIPEAYHFNGMADYQHVLAVHADATQKRKRNLGDVDSKLEKGEPDMDQDNLMTLVPPLFSRNDVPQKIILKSSGDLTSKKKPDTVVHQRPEIEIDECRAIDFNIDEIPNKVDWEKFIPRNSYIWKWQKIVCELFEERPIWAKPSLPEQLLKRGVNIREIIPERLVSLAAYYFRNGPFMRFWIRKGYDPRKDPESRIYQRTCFRVPHSLRTYCDGHLVSRMDFSWKKICEFQAFPHRDQITFLQLFELQDEYIQEEIRKPATQGNCSPQTGWFSSRVLNILRLHVRQKYLEVAQKFLSVYLEGGKQSSLRSDIQSELRCVTKELKRLHLNMKDKEVRQGDKEVVETEEKETNDEDEYEEDEDVELENENLGDDMDTADEEGNYYSLQGIYTEIENSSKQHLQDLVASFSFGGQNLEPYDGYDIYEDGNLSENEDY